MDTMYEMMAYSHQDLYSPQQILPVSASSDGYTLPTPPHSPLQITDISGSLMGGHRQYMEPVQTMPTDLSMHENLDNLDFHSVNIFEEKGWPADLPDFFTNPFDYQTFGNNMIPDTEDYVPSPTPSTSPVYCVINQHENIPASYIPATRCLGSVCDDSDQDGSLSDDTCVTQVTLASRRQDDYYTTTNPYHGAVVTSPQRTHNYQRNTNPISISQLSEIGKSNVCRTKKAAKKKSISSTDGHGKVKTNSRGKGRREAMKGNHLWEFIRDLLKNKSTCPRIIRWENRQEGVFRFVNSEAVAGLWGSKKNNPNMNYEKLSRAMRYYYKREILERVDGRRLVYKFGCNADGWKEAAAELTQDD